MQLALFDYHQLDSETRIVVQQRAGEIRALVRSTAENIMDIGSKLLEVQVKLGNGQFDTWLQHEFQWSRRTAYNFIGVHKQFGGRANFAQMDIATSALYLLAAPSTPDEARAEAIARAEAGERITHTEAKEIVAEHKGEPTKIATPQATITTNPNAGPAPWEEPQPDKKYKRVYIDPLQTLWCKVCGHKITIDQRTVPMSSIITCDSCGWSETGYGWRNVELTTPPADEDEMPAWLHDDDKPQYRRDQNKPAAESVATCACGAKLSPNDIRLGFTECKACERARIDAEDAAGLDVPPEAIEEPAYNYKRDAKTNRPGDLYEPKGYDACQTPPHAVDPLLPYLPTDMVIWEPAQGEGFLVEAFHDSFRLVIGSDILDGQNFFEYEPDKEWDVIVTNPPYSLKFKWLERCYELGKPFALLLPVETLGAATSQAMFEQYGMELLLLNKRVNFKMPNKGWDGAGAQFPVAWFTWGLNLGSSIVYGKLDPADQ